MYSVILFTAFDIYVLEKDPLVMKRTRKPVNPEEDILAQWRMMRRRELAQAGLKPPTTGPAATVRAKPPSHTARTHVSASCFKETMCPQTRLSWHKNATVLFGNDH